MTEEGPLVQYKGEELPMSTIDRIWYYTLGVILILGTAGVLSALVVSIRK